MLQPPFDSQVCAIPIWFPRKSIPHLLSGKVHAKPPKKTNKKMFFFSPCFLDLSRGLFAFVPLDLNFTNPKSTIFEPRWKTQPFPSNHDHLSPQIMIDYQIAYCGPRISAHAFPTRWRARFWFEKLIFCWLFENDSESPLIFVLFLKGKQNKKEKL